MSQHCKTIQKARQRLQILQSTFDLTHQQIQFFTQEASKALDGIQETTTKLTKDLCHQLRLLKNPSSKVISVASSFLQLLNYENCQWQSFRRLLENYEDLKSQMIRASNQRIDEQLLNRLLPIWKKRHMLQIQLSLISLGLGIIAEWIGHCIEFQLKNETLNALRKKLPELQQKLNKQIQIISHLSNVREIEQQQYSQQPSGFINYFYQDDFPNFQMNSDQLYGNSFGNGDRNEEEITFEPTDHKLGCCRINFFCI